MPAKKPLSMLLAWVGHMSQSVWQKMAMCYADFEVPGWSLELLVFDIYIEKHHLNFPYCVA